MVLPSFLPPEAPTPDSPQISIVRCALPLLEPRVSGYKRNFVCWTFKRLSASPAISPWKTETLLLFTAGCYLGSFPWLWCCRLGSPTWGLDPTLLRGNPLATEISLWNFNCHPWEPSQPSCTSSSVCISLVVAMWLLLSVCDYKASLQLVFSWLFRMIFL